MNVLEPRLVRCPLLGLSLPIKWSSPKGTETSYNAAEDHQQLTIRTWTSAKEQSRTPRRRLETEETDSGERACRGEWPDYTGAQYEDNTT